MASNQSLMRRTPRAFFWAALCIGPAVAHAQVPCAATNVEVVRTQIAAYNRKDVDGFARCYADSVTVVMASRPAPLAWNQAALRATYGGIFRRMPHATIALLSVRDTLGMVQTVERLTDEGGQTTEGTSRYRFSAGRIDAIYLGLSPDVARLPRAAKIDSTRLFAPGKPLTPRARDNLVAFARLVSVVRYFHPTDSVLLADWDRFTARGISAVEGADSPEALARILRGLFVGVAPTVQIFATSTPLAPVAAARPSDSSHAAIAYWEHRGVSVPTPSFRNASGTYRSSLRVDAAPGWLRPADVPDPDSAYVIQLEGGVTARVPLALWTTPPTDTALRARTPTFSWRVRTPPDRTMRLAGVIDIWGTMQHFYLYHEAAATDWPAALRVALNSAATDARPAQYATTLRRLVAALHDGHGNVGVPGEGGAYPLPLVFAMVEKQLTVVYVVPTMAPGLEVGDVVVRYNGHPASEVLAGRMALISSATTQWSEYRTVSELARAGAGETVTLTVRSGTSANAPLRHVRLVGGAASMDVLPSEPRPSSATMLRPGVMYIDLNTFTNADFGRQFAAMQQAAAVIFDLRGYPRMSTPVLLAHLSDSTVKSAHFEIPIFHRPDRAGVRFEDHAWTLAPIAPRLHARIIFIVDGRAISYAESTMGIVEYYHLGEIVGEPTAGTNGDINPFVSPSGYQIVWTGLQVRKQDGSRHHGVGIQPTVLVHRTLKGIREGRDELLERALQLTERGAR